MKKKERERDIFRHIRFQQFIFHILISKRYCYSTKIEQVSQDKEMHGLCHRREAKKCSKIKIYKSPREQLDQVSLETRKPKKEDSWKEITFI